MKQALQTIVKDALKRMDLVVLRESTYKERTERGKASDDLALLMALPRTHAPELLRLLSKAHAQHRQDLFVLSELGFKRGGYFVEFGATNGVDISNSYLLEAEFGWDGIVAEPARRWRDALRQNRRCNIDTDCVWRESGAILAFNEVSRPDLSTIDAFSDADIWRNARKAGHTYDVRTISLLDLLDRHHAPETIDYLSIDTEGSEFEILRAFDFHRYDIRLITVEHNFTPLRERIFDLLTTNGYRRKLETLSQCDDWYVKAR
jgi:FkbM family methyltransferase